MSTRISHAGVVESAEKGWVKVRILQTSACAACKVASHCNASDSKEKIVDVYDVRVEAMPKVGDSVVVWASRNSANLALLLGFGVPFLILVGVIFLLTYTMHNEGLAAMTAILALVPYYLMLYLFRHLIQRRLTFHLDNI